MKRPTNDLKNNPVTVKGKPYKLTKTGKIRKKSPLRGKNVKTLGAYEKNYALKGKALSKKKTVRKRNKSATADSFLLEVGKRLYQLRFERNLSQRVFGELVGMDNSKLAKIENGKVNISILTLRKICKVLTITPKQFWDF